MLVTCHVKFIQLQCRRFTGVANHASRDNLQASQLQPRISKPSFVWVRDSFSAHNCWLTNMVVHCNNFLREGAVTKRKCWADRLFNKLLHLQFSEFFWVCWTVGSRSQMGSQWISLRVVQFYCTRQKRQANCCLFTHTTNGRPLNGFSSKWQVLDLCLVRYAQFSCQALISTPTSRGKRVSCWFPVSWHGRPGAWHAQL
jgi:hypothetical protein